jgi:hypothetical protein
MPNQEFDDLIDSLEEETDALDNEVNGAIGPLQEPARSAALGLLPGMVSNANCAAMLLVSSPQADLSNLPTNAANSVTDIQNSITIGKDTQQTATVRASFLKRIGHLCRSFGPLEGFIQNGP